MLSAVAKHRDRELARCPEVTDSWQHFAHSAVALGCLQDISASKINVLACFGIKKQNQTKQKNKTQVALGGSFGWLF